MKRLGTWGALCAVALSLGSVAAAAPPGGELFVIEERVVTVEAPAPGDTQDVSFEVASAATGAHDVYIRVRAADGPLFTGTHPAQISVGGVGDAPVLTGPAGELVSDTHTALGAMAPGAPIRIAGEIALPRAAGNEYQGRSGTLTLELAATRAPDEGLPGGPVAVTGANGWWLIAAVGAVAVVGGTAVVWHRTRTRATKGTQ